MAVILILVFVGYWPVATVNGKPIFFYQFSRNYDIARHFYQNDLKIENKDLKILDSSGSQNEIKRATLDSMVDDSLIDQELAKRISSNDLNQILDNKLSNINLDDQSLKQGTEILYGLSNYEFKDYVLIPQAKEEILDGRLAMGGSNINDWLNNARKNAQVSIFIPGFYWDQGVKTK